MVPNIEFIFVKLDVTKIVVHMTICVSKNVVFFHLHLNESSQIHINKSPDMWICTHFGYLHVILAGKV